MEMRAVLDSATASTKAKGPAVAGAIPAGDTMLKRIQSWAHHSPPEIATTAGAAGDEFAALLLMLAGCDAE